MAELPEAMKIALENKREGIVSKHGQEMFDKAMAGQLKPHQLKMLLGGVASTERINGNV